jgi:hypothetical protein
MVIVEVVKLSRGSASRGETGGAGIGESGGGNWLDRRGLVEEDVAEFILKPSQGDLDGRVGPVAALLLVARERRRR